MWLNDWFGLISPFIRLSELMLELLRLDTYEYDLITEAGQCHLELKSSEEVFLIQILYDDDLIFPTIIYGKHRLSVHFQEMSQRMEQTLRVCVHFTMKKHLHSMSLRQNNFIIALVVVLTVTL